MPVLQVKHCLHIFHMSKTFNYLNSIEKRINKFAKGYMVNPKLNVKRIAWY